MKNAESWKPSKYVPTRGGWRASLSPEEVARGSRLIVDIVARVYENAIREHARGVLLDLGCGKVPLYGIYKDHVSHTVCVDWANTLHKSPHVDYEFDLTREMPLPSERYDTILVTDVLEHIPNPDLLWHEMARLLRPAGKIILGVPFCYWIHEEPHDYYRYTEFKLRAFCQDNGLAVLMLEPYGGAPEIILDITGKLLASGGIRSRLHLALSRVVIASSIGRKLRGLTARSFPMGYCLVAQRAKER